MKANLKGLSGIKGFMLLHGEKLLMFGVGLCAALIVYNSLSLEPLDERYEASKLQQTISKTKSAIEEPEWSQAVAEHPDQVRITPPDQDVAKQVASINPGHYQTSPIGWDQTVILPTVPRTDPVLLAAGDVQVRGGSGLFAIIDEKIIKERNLARQAEEAQKAQEEAKKAQQALEEQSPEGGGSYGPGSRGRGPGGEMGMTYEVDPDFPNRRPIEGMSQLPGAPTMGDEKVQRAFWAVVVAKVPIKEQLKLYRDAFENTRGGFNPDTDFPRYAGFFIQRAEVQPGKELQWTKVSVTDGQGKVIGPYMSRQYREKLFMTISKEWANLAQQPEVVDPRYLDPSSLLAFPLPPLLGRDWGADVTHPDIPLIVNAPPPEEELDPTLAQPTETPVDPNDENSGFQPTDPSAGGLQPGGEGGGYGGGYGGGGAYGPSMGGRGMGEMRGSGGYGGGGYGGGGGGRGTYGPGMGGRGMGGEMGRGSYGPGMGGGYGGAGLQGGTLPRNVTHWLLRFYDFTVEPGKKYKYRVRLVLDDPNSTVNNPLLQANTLDSSVVKRIKESPKIKIPAGPNTGLGAATATVEVPLPIRFADWSEPSPTVGIPLAGSVRLASAKPPAAKLANDEPAATLLVEAFDLDEKGNAVHAGVEKELRRGFVANSIEEAEYVTSDQSSIDKMESFKFMTGVTVVDVRGGNPLSKDLQSPAQVLLLDPSGELYIRSELDDTAAVKMHKQIFAKPDKRRQDGDLRGSGGYGGGGRGGGGGGGEGRGGGR